MNLLNVQCMLHYIVMPMNGFDSNTKIIRVTPKWEKQANILLGVVSTVWGACLAWGVAEVVLAVKKSRLLKK